MKAINSISLSLRNKKKEIVLILGFTALISVVFNSCIEHKSSETMTSADQIDTTRQDAAKQASESEIVTAFATDKTGMRLDMAFNNSKRTAVFTFKGETIEMKQDAMGSGVKYSNEKYEYTEWHSRIELKKEGKTIFVISEEGKNQTGK